MRSPWRKWSAEEDAALRAAIDARLSLGECARRIGRTYKAVVARRSIFGLPHFTARRQKKHLAAVRQLHWLGKTSAEVAAAIGLSLTTVNLYRREMDLPPFDRAYRNTRKDAWGEDEDVRLKAAINAGLNPAETAGQIGRTVRAVKSRRIKLELPFFKRQPRTPPPPKWPPDRVEQLAALRRKGHSYREAARILHATPGAIAGAIRDHLKESANA